ncbi:MAG: hypothetical protein GY862_02095, partial [Gammaproteobacteria bacterium]|nr:hypothetical protein [Gammaproteobacteria bacterium]
MAKKISAVWARITRDFLLKRLFWRKRLCRRDLVDTLHVSTAQASLLLAA